MPCESLEKCKFASISNRLKIIIESGHCPSIDEAADQIDDLRRLFCDNEQGSPVLHWKDNELFLYPKALWWKEVKDGRVKRYLDSIVELITYHEIKEGLTLFELALWNAKMDQADEVIYACDRARYRAGVPEPVKDAIVQYMHGVNIPVPSSHTKMANSSSCEEAASASVTAKGTDTSSNNNENGRDAPTKVRQAASSSSAEGLSSHVLQFLPSGLNGDWHSDNDLNHRREMIQHIKQLLKQKDNPQMIKQLEVSLYRSASSLQVYSDTTTLKTRLQQLAMQNAKKRKNDEVTSSQHGNPNDPEWKVRIRHKQQRLLLLHHSSKCMHEDGKCKVTPYCGEMKKLWKHMAHCTDNECRIPHCISSRSILSHHRKCKDPRCPACGPVRETIRKTQNSQKGRGGNQSGGSSGGD